MRLFLSVLIPACAACAALTADPSGLPAAEELLQDVRSRLPPREIRVSGELEVRGRKGVVMTRMNVDARLALGGTPPTASYTVRDALGGELEELTVTGSDGNGAPRVAYRRGDPPEDAEPPGVFKTIGDSDLTWTDLTLAFLNWEGGVTTGREVYKGQPCFVLELPVPADARPEDARMPYARMRLWIHESLRMFAKAEAYDAADNLVRRIEIKALRRVNGRWMIKDMEVESFPAVHKTRFRIREVEGVFEHDGDPVQ